MSVTDVQLLPHNEEAFNKLKKCLEDNQLVAINHATGTGKSFIILKYLWENRDKNILFLSPSYPINEQLIEEHMKDLNINVSQFNKLDTLIYRNLLKMNMEELASQYDIIILDEYHRCGAKQWGIKVNELLAHIKEKYPNTKVIGTTATEIRYLDNEKNMNNILFDGVCASTLTLADAMLKEILPVPIYISSLVELSFEYEKKIKKVYSKTLYDEERKYYLDLISDIRNEIDELISSGEDIRKYIKKDGKHLVFSSTIDNIEKDKSTLNKLFDYTHHEYVVHSRRDKKANTKALHDFRYDDKACILYCVNILNEGVHVNGVDSIFMLRPTTSPIIFFQQLGRLLSYSRRKDNVVVFDLVNNIRKSPYIYRLYIDLFKKAKELIEKDPDNKERYLKIVKSFKIVDAASKIYEKLDIIKKSLSDEQFYQKRIDFIIGIINGTIEANEVEKRLARIDLFKYYKYITLEQFKIIKDLDVEKPYIFNQSLEEFENMLSGEKNIYMKEKNKSLLVVNKINDFYNNYGYFPSIFGKDIDEVNIAYDLINIYDCEIIDETIFENKDLNNLSEYEKIIYRIDKQIDFNLLYSEIDKLIPKKIIINSLVLGKIKEQNTKISNYYFDKIIKYNAIILNEKIKKDNKDEKLKIINYKDFESIAKSCIQEIKKYNSLEEYLKDLADEIVNYITETKRMPIYYMSGISYEELEKMRTLYVKKIIFYDNLKSLGYIDLFEKTYDSIQMELADLNKNVVLNKLIVFLKDHYGDMPSVKIEEEKSLAFQVNRIKDLLTDQEVSLINSYRSDSRTREVVIRYIAFVKKYKRYPLTTATDEEEKQLLNEYIRNEAYFSESDKMLIINLKKTISSKTAMQNAYIELLNQKKRR